MSKVVKWLTVVLVALGVAVNGSIQSQASTMDFNVSPIGKEHEKYGYFKLQVKPNQTVSLPIKVDNLSDKKIEVEISSLNALTSKYGNIQYVQEKKLGDATYTDSKYAFKTYAQKDMTVTLKPNESKKVNFKVTLPSSLDKGTLLGGLSFKDKSEQEKGTEEEGIKINNELERVVGVQLDYGKRDNGKIKLKDGVSVVKNTSIPYINVGLENNTAEIVEGVGVTYKVYEGNKQVFGGETNEFKMAPKSKFELPIDWGSDTFKSGNYTIQIVASANGKVDEKSMQFQIENKDVKLFKEATKDNAREIKGEEGSTFLINLVYGLIGLVIGFLVFWIWGMIKKRKEKESNMKGS